MTPYPLFDTYETFLSSTSAEYLAEHPSIQTYLQGFAPIPAFEDYGHIRAFLQSYSGQATTFKAYRTQVERLALWSWIVAGKALTDLRRSDAEQYLQFCMSPPADWVGADVRKRFLIKDGAYVPNPQWTPFSMPPRKAEARAALATGRELAKQPYRMAQASVKLLFTVCSSFFDFLVQDGRTELLNPFRAIKQKSRFVQTTRVVSRGRCMTQLQWDYVFETAERMAQEDPERHERTLFIMMTVFSMYLRISDLVGTPTWESTFGAFAREGDFWWYYCCGKGNVLGKVSVRAEYLPYLVRYRRFRGLSDYPAPGEKTPLLAKLNGEGGLTDRQVRRIIQDVFDAAAARMQADGRAEDEYSALRAASAHWLRHTSATFDAEFRPAKHLQHDLRHKSMSTTQDIYYHALDDERASTAAAMPLRR